MRSMSDWWCCTGRQPPANQEPSWNWPTVDRKYRKKPDIPKVRHATISKMVQLTTPTAVHFLEKDQFLALTGSTAHASSESSTASLVFSSKRLGSICLDGDRIGSCRGTVVLHSAWCTWVSEDAEVGREWSIDSVKSRASVRRAKGAKAAVIFLSFIPSCHQKLHESVRAGRK